MPFSPILNHDVSHVKIQHRLVLAEGQIEDLQRECAQLQKTKKRLCSALRKIRKTLRVRNDEFEGMHMETQGLEIENEWLKQKLVKLEQCEDFKEKINRSFSSVTTNVTSASMSEDSDVAELDISIAKTRSFISRRRGRRRRKNQQRYSAETQKPAYGIGASLDSSSSALNTKDVRDTSFTTIQQLPPSSLVLKRNQPRSSTRMEKMEEKLRMLSSPQSIVVPPKRSSSRSIYQQSAITIIPIMKPMVIPQPQVTFTANNKSTMAARRGPLVPKRFAQNIVASPFS